MGGGGCVGVCRCWRGGKKRDPYKHGVPTPGIGAATMSQTQIEKPGQSDHASEPHRVLTDEEIQEKAERAVTRFKKKIDRLVTEHTP